MALEKELDTFHKELQNLLNEGNRGKFVLICGEEIGGVWPTLEEALDEGYSKYGIEPFMVKEITDHEEPKFFSRNVKRCH